MMTVTTTQATLSPTPRARNAGHPFSMLPVRTLKFCPQNPARKLMGRKIVATVASRRLAAVATIFLPISFLAGFWGQNFNVLTGNIEKGWPAFLFLGVGLSAACAGVTVFMLSRRNWN